MSDANIEWVKLAQLSDIGTPGAVKVDIDDLQICIARDSAGDVHALDDTCSHAAVSLSEGEVEDDGIECWLHGSKFAYATGEPMSLPATQPVNVYPTKLEGDNILVGIPA